MPRKKAPSRKIFVLDTSVIIHDHQAVVNFQEHDVAIPITVLEELDNFKAGNSTKNYEARAFIRFIDHLSEQQSLTEWLPINGPEKGKFKVIMDQQPRSVDAEKAYDSKKSDHKIINAAIRLQEETPDAKVTLVTKDVNLRLKAKALNLASDDYLTGKVKDVSNLYTGRSLVEDLPTESIDALYETGFAAPKVVLPQQPVNNHYYILRNTHKSTLAYYNPFTDTMERVEKRTAYGIKPKNAEQAFALHAVLQSDVRLVTIQGVAGTGKTLLALAGALEQRSMYRQILLARPIVALSNKDLGFLPGDAEHKVLPYMEPLFDNLKFIKSQFSETDAQSKKIDEMLQNEKIVITPLAYIRGRSLSKVFFIIDEAQNLTPLEVKTIITRAGEGTKIIFTGDIHQIDTPYLDEESNGLSYLIEKLKGQKLFAHVNLEKGERSELANLATELL